MLLFIKNNYCSLIIIYSLNAFLILVINIKLFNLILIMESKIYFITSGKQKYEEIKDLIPPAITIERLEYFYPEDQDMDLRNICRIGAKWVADRINKPVIVDDMGLFINALGGLPGPFTKFFAKYLKPEGVLKLMNGLTDRSASFKVCLGFCKPGSEPLTFMAERKGVIADEVLTGPYDFGLNSIFIPENSGKNLAAFSFEEKLVNEPRRIAFKELINTVMNS